MLLPKTVKISDEVLFQEIEGECVLLNLSNEQYFGLDEVGTRFWHLISADGKSENALKSLQKEYAVNEETLRNDLTLLINELKEQGLVTIED
jgi:hypothetical protein